MEPNLVPLVSKMVLKMTPKPHPGPLRTRPKKKHVFLMHFHPTGTLKIIKSAILSSILRFSQCSTSASKYHSPGLLLDHFSAPAGIEKVPRTRYKTLRELCPSKYGPQASKGSKSCSKCFPNGTQNHLKIHFGPPLVPTACSVAPNHRKMSPKRYPNGDKYMRTGLENT